MRRRLIGILFLACLVAPFMATYSWLQYEKYQVRKTVKQLLIQQLAPEQLVSLSFSTKNAATQIHWEHPREFEFNGELYDVVSCDTLGKTLVYRCWPDHAETTLNQQLRQLVAGALESDSGQTGTQLRFFGFYLTLFHQVATPWQLTTPSLDHHQDGFFYAFVLQKSHLLPSDQPPELS